MTDFFTRESGQLFAEQVPLTQLAADFGTPLFVYSRAALEHQLGAWQQALGEGDLICYAVKANSNIALLQVLAAGGSGFDIVSGGELERVVRAGGDPSKVIFSGVGKTVAEIERALELQILCFNVESEAELERVSDIAKTHGVTAPISVRVNPDVDAKTHPYISTGLRENKFGIDIRIASAVYQRAASMPNLHVSGIDCHIGSQLTDLAPYYEALDRVLSLIDSLNETGLTLEHLDLGGGLGVRYQNENPPPPEELVAGVRARMNGRSERLLFEPGRSIAANAGVLISRVEYLKSTDEHAFAIVDAAMNDLLRPALYSAWMAIEEVDQGLERAADQWDIVGPVCESADFLGRERELRIAQGDLLCVRGAGAYGFVMSSNYNSRPRAAEILIDGDRVHLARARENVEDLMQGEALLDQV
jgi:diaminopimelate decarboxylase